MKTTAPRWPAVALAASLLAALATACVVGGGAYGPGYDASVGIGLDYYEPSGVFYGGWAPGYHVVPGRESGHRADRAAERAPPRYRPAPPGRPVPSIPSRSRPAGPRTPSPQGRGDPHR